MSKHLSLLQQIESIVGKPGLIRAEGLVGRSAGVWSTQALKALALVRPANTQEVSEVMKLCHAAGQVVIPVGGMTGLADGHYSRSTDILLSTERINQIDPVDVDSRNLVVGAGAILQRVQDSAVEVGLMFALDIGARASCTIGGNIATNAGGVRVLRYGMMREQLLGLEAVLADGTVISSMFGLLKNNTGYDLRQMFVGSEGTLGIVTRAVLRLREAPVSIDTALLAVPSWAQVMKLLRHFDHTLAGTLGAFEVLWRNDYELNTGDYSTVEPPIAAETPYYVIVDSLDFDGESGRNRFEESLASGFEQGDIVDAVLANSETERATLWQIREDFEPQLKKFDQMYAYDVSLPLRSMEDYVESVRQQINQQDAAAEVMAFGHVGDDNLHLSIYPAGIPDRSRVDEIVYASLQPLNGSVSAEHGIGLEKKRYLKYTRNEAEIELMRRLKRMMDPGQILNPGKIFDL